MAFVGGLPDTTTNLQRQSAFITRVAELCTTLAANLSGGEHTYEAIVETTVRLISDGEVVPGRPVKTHVLPCPLNVRQSTTGGQSAVQKA